MALSRREIAKDVLQQSTEAAIASAGHVVAILFESARKITTEIGAFGTEIFEITEASKRAGQDGDGTNPAAE
ncbi:hypothetical protein ASE12_00525 [Aeromicrobium sp. Root236]|uniref:Uncharacterized protein n=1 Tax=Aeromicrobium ginsengisoli TaxID=363867 RepID=A0A5M4FIM2_9ACTN|nr:MULTISPECIES: hypothetical protein [Aeromicrobium]KAA1399808.1 hypothetical protein ESP70_003355 [Aeromicrobium ginsengisoli]KRC63374.1 hypothetical protein ASE12_00525 [Aeromicrobium sp. Root236]